MRSTEFYGNTHTAVDGMNVFSCEPIPIHFMHQEPLDDAGIIILLRFPSPRRFTRRTAGSSGVVREYEDVMGYEGGCQGLYDSGKGSCKTKERGGFVIRCECGYIQVMGRLTGRSCSHPERARDER
jgi:hypothetical protein